MVDFGQKQKSSSWTTVIFSALGIYLCYVFYSYLTPSTSPTEAGPTVSKATAYLSGTSPVTGTISFSQSSPSAPVVVSLNLTGLEPMSRRGLHIHQFGDLSNGCMSTGVHFNPHGKNHGAPTDSERHIGDLGNIHTDEAGSVNVVLEDKEISLNGPYSVIGRAVVVHTGVDDLGKGGNEDSLKTGNAGGRAACGVIGLV